MPAADGNVTPQGAQDADAATPRRRLSRTRVAVALVGVLAVGAVALWLATPVSYREYQLFLAGNRPADLEQTASEVEARCRTALEAARAAGLPATWIAVEQREASVWLTQRAHQFLVGHELMLPKHMQDLMVEAEGDHLVLRFRLVTREMEPVVSLRVRPVAHPDGMLALRATGVRAGRLPVPFSALTGVLHKQVRYPEDQAALRHLASWLDGRPFDTGVDVDGAGRVQLTGLTFDRKGVRLRLTAGSTAGDEAAAAAPAR